MKMGIGTRIVFTIFLLIVMALCVAIILASFGGFARADLVALLNGFWIPDINISGRALRCCCLSRRPASCSLASAATEEKKRL